MALFENPADISEEIQEEIENVVNPSDEEDRKTALFYSEEVLLSGVLNGNIPINNNEQVGLFIDIPSLIEAAAQFDIRQYHGVKTAYIESQNISNLEVFNIAGRGKKELIKADNIADPLRKDLEGYWAYFQDQSDNNTLDLAKNVPDDFPVVLYGEYQQPRLLNPSQEGALDSEYPMKLQRIRTFANRGHPLFTTNGEYDPVKWSEYFDEFRSGDRNVLELSYTDFTFDQQKALSRENLETHNIPGAGWADISHNYNFYEKLYEENLANKNTIEQNLPNHYLLMIASKNATDELPDSEFAVVHTTLSGSIKQVPKPPGKRLGRDKDNDPRRADYFKIFYRIFGRRYENNETNGEIANKANNFVFSKDAFLSFQQGLGKRYAHPMHVELQFRDNTFSQIGYLLEQHNFLFPLMLKFAEVQQKGELGTMDFNQYLVNIFSDKPLDDSTASLESMGFEDWLNNFEQEGPNLYDDEFINNNFTLLSFDKDTSLLEANSDLVRSFRMLTFKSQLRSFINEQLRTIEDVYSGRRAYTETLFYIIKKQRRESNGELSEPIQTFYVPNIAETDIINFIDTQVVYNREYQYTIESCKFVMGGEYVHFLVRKEDEEAGLGIFDTIVQPRMKLMVTPYYQDSVQILDEPPMFPDVEIASYKNVNNRLLLMLRESAGRLELDPIVFNEDEERNIELLRLSQKKLPFEPIFYSNDDPPSEYLIYRLTTRPTSYSDFENALIKTLDTQTATTFADTVQPNVKYYYVFRARDVHGHLSNPSVVYEAELNDDDGAIFLTLTIVSLEIEEDLNSKKSLKRYAYIAPSFAQSILNFDKSGLRNAETAKGKKPVLGIRREGTFGKRFKIRFTSKHTGKRFDLNVRFRQKHTEINEES